MGVLFKHVQYWLTKEIYRYPIKKSKYVYTYSLPQRLSTHLDLNPRRYGKKNMCGKFLFFNSFSDMTFFLQLRELSVTNPRIRAYQKNH
jgi:hypothetical protein